MSGIETSICMELKSSVNKIFTILQDMQMFASNRLDEQDKKINHLTTSNKTNSE